MAFELWYWRRLLRVPWTARISNQSILKEISPGYSLEGLMLKLKLHTLATWCKELSHWKRPWCWEGVGAGREGDDRGWDGWMASPTRWTWVWVNSGSWWWTGRPGVLQFMGSQGVRHDWATELDWRKDKWVFLVAQPVKNPPVWMDSLHKESNVEDLGLIPGLRLSSREGNGYPLQYSSLENSMDRGAWQTTIHGVEENWTRLSDSHFLFMERHTTPHQAVHAPPKWMRTALKKLI